MTLGEQTALESFILIHAAAAESCFLLLAGTAKFRIIWISGETENFEFDLSFIPPLLGKGLREEIARRSGFRAADLRLEQRRARRRKDGAVLVRSWNGFRDEKGKKVESGDWEGEYGHEIQDNEEVPLAGQHVTWIRAEKLSRR